VQVERGARQRAWNTTSRWPSERAKQSALLAEITRHGAANAVRDAGSLVVGDERASADERIAVYARMYRARLAEALASQFPRLAKEVGTDDFAALSAAYAAEHPSVHPSLRFLGERFAAWLEQDDPTLAGLAKLEWARTDVFDQRDQPLLSLDDLRSWPAQRFAELPLELVTAHRLLQVPRGTDWLWDSIGSEQPLSEPAQHSAEPHESLLVWREGIAVFHRVVDDSEAVALAKVARGAPFGVVCESLLGKLSEEAAVAKAFSWLSTWIVDQLIVAVEPPA